MKVVINADDFGARAEVNAAIIRSFQNGWISSTTIMANMPGFAEACALSREHALGGRVGLHFNLAEGKPLSVALARQPRFCTRDGQLRFRVRDGLWLSKQEREAVADELRAQWRSCIESGVQPSHLDSHHHTHLGWAVAGVVIRLASELRIPAVRIYWNVVPSGSVPKRLYVRAINQRFRKAGLVATPYMAHSKDGALAVRKGLSPLELMVHPQLAEDGTVTDYRGGRAMAEVFTSLGLTGPLCSFQDLTDAHSS